MWVQLRAWPIPNHIRQLTLVQKRTSVQDIVQCVNYIIQMKLLSKDWDSLTSKNDWNSPSNNIVHILIFVYLWVVVIIFVAMWRDHALNKENCPWSKKDMLTRGCIYFWQCDLWRRRVWPHNLRCPWTSIIFFRANLVSNPNWVLIYYWTPSLHLFNPIDAFYFWRKTSKLTS